MSPAKRPTTEAATDAPPAMHASTGEPLPVRRPRGAPPLLGRDDILSSASESPPGTELGTPTSPPPSETPSSPSSDSIKRYRKPRDLQELAAQINEIATMVLNGGTEENRMTPDQLDQVRLYANLARTGVQAMSVQTQRSRFLREAPTISLEMEDD